MPANIVCAGRRNKLITIQKPTVTSTTGGEPVETWSTLAKVWAAVEPLNAREAFNARQVQAVTTHKIAILYRSDVTPAMRATWNSRTFKFESIINRDEADRETIIMAFEVT